MELRVRSRREGDAVLVEIGGEIDLHTAPQVRVELQRANEGPAPRVVVDLSEVVFIDSTGIGVLVGGLKGARERSGNLFFCGAQTRVHRIFQITGLLYALPLYATRKEAFAAFEPALPEEPEGGDEPAVPVETALEGAVPGAESEAAEPAAGLVERPDIAAEDVATTQNSQDVTESYEPVHTGEPLEQPVAVQEKAHDG